VSRIRRYRVAHLVFLNNRTALSICHGSTEIEPMKGGPLGSRSRHLGSLSNWSSKSLVRHDRPITRWSNARFTDGPRSPVIANANSQDHSQLAK